MMSPHEPYSSSPLIFEASRRSATSPRVVYTSAVGINTVGINTVGVKTADIDAGAGTDAGVGVDRGAKMVAEAGGSTKPDGFNLSYKVKDDERTVSARRDALAEVIARPLSLLEQVHSATVVDLDEVLAGIAHGDAASVSAALVPLATRQADAQITTRRDVALGIFTADCTPVLFSDSVHGVFGAAHAGRRGVENGIVPATLAAMQAKGASADALEIWFGPNICGTCYETGDAIAAEFESVCPGASTVTRFGGAGVDMRAALRDQLASVGISETQIHDADPAIAEQTEAWLRTQEPESATRHSEDVAGTAAQNFTPMCTLENPLLYSYREWSLTHRPGSNGRFLSILLP